MAITFVDITDGKAKEEHMESIARSDPLTGVRNRRGFERDASKRLTDSPDDATGALLFIYANGLDARSRPGDVSRQSSLPRRQQHLKPRFARKSHVI
jgi:hypothetical protein